MKKQHSSPPWQEPWRLAWFCLAIILSAWAIVFMAQGTTTAWQALSAKGIRFSKIFCMVGVAAILGGVTEARCWHLYLAKGLGRITRAAHMPSIVAVSMPTALYSSMAANSLLVSCHAEGRMPTAALIAGGMLNSYMVYISHSLRVLYPVVGLIGAAGISYFAIQFLGGLLVISGILLWHYKHSPKPDDVHNPDESLPSTTDKRHAVKPWPDAFKLGAKRAAVLMFRMVCITVPLMVAVEWVVKSDAIHIWNEHIPDWLSVYFPPELLTVVVAQLGGLVQSSAVAANLHAEGLISSVHIVLGMLVASVMGSPFRTMRRNLPSSLATFTAPVALTIVLGMQAGRFLVNCTAIAIIIYGMTHFSW
ncbi:MAG: hypothetical protein R3Y11_04400 [Pseudomonadota bacterium]